MKLKKKELLRMIKPRLIELGYTWFKESYISDCDCFCKKINKEFYLSLCPTIHRFYDDQFTADYYLSTTNSIFATYGDIPFECDKRIGFLLNEEELKEYFKEEYEAGHQPKDVWWNPYKGNSIDDFISKVRLTEPRMLSNKELIVDIYKSKTISELKNESVQTKKIFQSKDFSNNLQNTPIRNVDNIPIDWFKAAETAIILLNQINDKNSVRYTASIAYREYVLDQMSLVSTENL